MKKKRDKKKGIYDAFFRKYKRSIRPPKPIEMDVDNGEGYKLASDLRCRERQLKMIKHDARIGMGYDFKNGGSFEDMSFEKERTLLQLWYVYRNGYTSDQVLNTMYVPVVIVENGGRVKCTAERCALDDTMISELRARYQGIKEEEMILREQEELAKYNELHGIQKPGGIGTNLLEAMAGSPRSSRAQSVLSYAKGKITRKNVDKRTNLQTPSPAVTRRSSAVSGQSELSDRLDRSNRDKNRDRNIEGQTGKQSQTIALTNRQATNQTSKQTDKQTDKLKNSGTNRLAPNQTSKQKQNEIPIVKIESESQWGDDGRTKEPKNSQNVKQTVNQTSKQTDKQTPKQADTLVLKNRNPETQNSQPTYTIKSRRIN